MPLSKLCVSLLLLMQDAPPLDYASLSASTDYSCILRHWRIIGVGVCIRDFKPRPCLRVENPWPVGIFEVTPHDYASSIKEVDPVLTSIRPAARAVSPVTPKTSSHTGAAQAGSSTRFAEARILEFAPPIDFLQAQIALPVAAPCARSLPLALRYLSELDSFGWRNDALDQLFYLVNTAAVACDIQWPANLQGCAGNWGSYYPRTGWVSHPSSVIASYLQMLHAARVATEPAPGRIILGPYAQPVRTGHYYQLVSPRVR